MEAPVMASAVLVVGGPFWGENGHLCQGIDNDPRKLRGMLRRLDLPGWDDPAGVEANQVDRRGFGQSGGHLIPIWTDGGLALLVSGSPGQMGGQSRAAAVFCPTSQILSGGAKSTRERNPLAREDSSRKPPVRRSCT
eukprot:COSAG06_NODE_10592_length_1652_cov_1.389569_2_plen_137_part_00